MAWDRKQVDTLRTLWLEGHSATEIGRRMGITKCAVVGKSGRLNLPGRPSPIRKKKDGSPPTPKTDPETPKLPEVLRQEESTPDLSLFQSAAEPIPVTEEKPSRRRVQIESCLWPEGEPSSPEFRFCGEGTLPGKSYCPGHAALAYTGKSDPKILMRILKV